MVEDLRKIMFMGRHRYKASRKILHYMSKKKGHFFSLSINFGHPFPCMRNSLHILFRRFSLNLPTFSIKRNPN